MGSASAARASAKASPAAAAAAVVRNDRRDDGADAADGDRPQRTLLTEDEVTRRNKGETEGMNAIAADALEGW